MQTLVIGVQCCGTPGKAATLDTALRHCKKLPRWSLPSHMSEAAAYFALFSSAFLSATLLPGSSEAALIAFLAAGQGDPVALVTVATAGNVLGSVVNWILGRFFAHFRDRRWFPFDRKSYDRAIGWYGRYGIWSLLFAWLPVVGDPLTLIAGVLRTDLRWFLLLVTAGKAARYLVIGAGFLWWSH